MINEGFSIGDIFRDNIKGEYPNIFDNLNNIEDLLEIPVGLEETKIITVKDALDEMLKSGVYSIKSIYKLTDCVNPSYIVEV
jgi:hypothetical protein